MTELSFAKSFLATLDNRSIKLQPDHVADIKTLELKGPYTLPRYPSSPSMRPPSSTTPVPPTTNTNTIQSTTTTLSPPNLIPLLLKSARPPPSLSLSLTLPPQTTIHELKTHVSAELPKQAGRTGQGTTEGIKILYQRKPVADAKTVGEVVGAGAGEGEGGKAVEFGVIVMGGGTAATAAGTGEKGTVVGKGDDGDTPMGGTEPVAGEVPVAQGISGEEVLQSAEFWDDLKGWLMQRVRDEAVAERCWSLFKRGWDER